MNALLVSHRASSAVWVATSVHRQPFVPLHLCNDSHLCRCIVQRLCVAVFMHPCITALCGCLYASLHNDFVRPLSCILCTFMNALLVSHPCETLGVHFIRHPCLTRKLRVLPPAAPKIIPRLLSGRKCSGVSNCGRLGRCIVQRLCATAIVHPCTTRTVRVRPPHHQKKQGYACLGIALLFLVPMAGVEPARYCYQRILSPSRLPIPSHRLIKMCCKTALHNGNSDFTV